MTTASYHRCTHCGVLYTYYGSGPPCMDPLNDSRWCRACTEVASDALATVPRRFECRYQDIREIPKLAGITLDDVLGWEKDLQARIDAKEVLPFRRIFSPLFNLDTGDSQDAREVPGGGEWKGYRFKLTTWKKSPEYTIEVPREYDLTEKRFTGNDWPHHIVRNHLITEPLAEPVLPPRQGP